MKQTHFKNNTLTIRVEEIPLVIKAILTLLLSICFLMPILVTFFLFNTGIILGIVMSFAFFGVIGFFILRFLLWNHYGKEIIRY